MHMCMVDVQTLVCVIHVCLCYKNFISRLIFEPTLGTSERVRRMWEIDFFTMKKGFLSQFHGPKDGEAASQGFGPLGSFG